MHRSSTAIILLVAASTALAQVRDMTFGNGGLLAMPMSMGSETVRQMAFDEAGFIHLAGIYRGYYQIPTDREWWAARVLPNGPIDTSFAGQGYMRWDICTGDEAVAGLDVDPDGGVYITGHEGFGYLNWYDYGVIGKLSADGVPDPGYGAYPNAPGVAGVQFGPTMKTHALASVRLADGSRNGLFHRYYDNGMVLFARFDPQGLLDTTFIAPVSGTQLHGPGTVTLQAVPTPDGGFMVLGCDLYSTAPFDFMVSKVDSTGTLDTTYADSGTRVLQGLTNADHPRLVRLDAMGRSIVCAYSRLIRITQDGDPDPSFGVDGVVPLSTGVKTFTTDPQGGIVAFCADQQGEFVARWHPDGVPDTSFGTNGRLVLPLTIGNSTLAMDYGPDGRLFFAFGCTCPNWMPQGVQNSALVMMFAYLMDPSSSVAGAMAPQLVLAPNPALDRVRISLMDAHDVLIEVFDLHGRLVLRDGSRGPERMLDVSGLDAGSYLVRASGPHGAHGTHRLMVVR